MLQNLSMQDNDLLEPLKQYPAYQSKIEQAANQYFDELLAASKVDPNKNATDADRYYEQQQKTAGAKEAVNAVNRKRGLATFLAVLSLVAAGILTFISAISIWADSSNWLPYVFLAFSFVIPLLAVFMLRWKHGTLQKQLDAATHHANAMQKEQDNMYDALMSSVEPLCVLYEWGMPNTVLNRTLPSFLHFDENFDIKRYLSLVGNYGYKPNDDPMVSTLGVQSGACLGNPFILEKELHCTIRKKAYTGSLVIHWTTTYTDSKGNTHVEHHTQTLHATVYHPAPFYDEETYLRYANEAAPRLCFTRTPQVSKDASEKDIKKQVQRVTKDLQKDIENGNTKITLMSNNEFDALWGAFDRNNEVEFRLLFTPLAQQNEVALITDKQYYGDDFTFIKNHKMNTIYSQHSQSFDYFVSPYDFYDVDIRKMRANFVTYCLAYFRSLYFDLAPLLSIPLYQQTKSVDYLYGEDAPMNLSADEQEVMANALGVANFSPDYGTTRVLLRAKFLKKEGNEDLVHVRATNYYSEPRVDYVACMGGDGEYHNVPVHWDEYFRTYRNSLMKVQNLDTTRHDLYNSFNEPDHADLREEFKIGKFAYQRKLSARIVQIGRSRYPDKKDSEDYRQDTDDLDDEQSQ